MTEFDFYKREKINDRLWVVTESYGVNSTFRVFVIIGETEVVVVDAGLGAQSGLRRYIETFITGSDKPMSVVLTHTHPDHVGGAPLFDKAYCSPLEFPDLAWNRNHYRRFGDLEWFCGHDRWKDEPDHDVINYCFLHFVRELLLQEDCVPVNDGDVLFFGDIELEAILCPTHSAGSICYYDRAANVAFVGDAVQHWNGFPGKEKGAEYVKWLERLISKLPEDVTVLNAHDEGMYTMGLIRDVLQCTKEFSDPKNLEKDGPIGYTNHFHVKRPGYKAPAEMRDHWVNDVRLSYNPAEI